MNLDPNRTYHLGELRAALEKQRKEKEEKDNATPVVAPVNKTHLEDKDISDKNCIYLSGDTHNVINILNRKIMYRNGSLWCPDHGDKCIISPNPQDSFLPSYKCSLMTTQAGFGMGVGKVISGGKRTPLFFFNFSSDVRKIVAIAALLQFEQMNMAAICKFNASITYAGCQVVKEALTRAQLHDTRTLQILQNQWNLFKRYCAYHKLNHLKHLEKIIADFPFKPSARGAKRKKVETVTPIIFNAKRESTTPFIDHTIKQNEKFVKVDASVANKLSFPIPHDSISSKLTIAKASEALIKAIEDDINRKHQAIYDDMNSYKEDALKYRRMMVAMNG